MPVQIYVPRAQSHDPLLSVLSSLYGAFVDKIKESDPTATVYGIFLLSHGVVRIRPAGSQADWCVAHIHRPLLTFLSPSLGCPAHLLPRTPGDVSTTPLCQD